MLCPKSRKVCITTAPQYKMSDHSKRLGNHPTENTFIAKGEFMCKLTKEEEYSIISRTMTNIRSLRTYVRERF